MEKAKSKERWTNDQDRMVLDLWGQGKSNKEIGEVVGRTASAVQSRASHLNCGTKDVRQNVIQVTADGKRLWSKEEDRLLIEMRRQGRTAREIGVSLGRSVMSVSGRIRHPEQASCRQERRQEVREADFETVHEMQGALHERRQW